MVSPFPETALNRSIADRFREIALLHAGKVALHTEEAELSYTELLVRTYPVTAMLNQSVEAGARVAILLPQGPQFISAMMGCLASGVAYIPLDSSYPAD